MFGRLWWGSSTAAGSVAARRSNCVRLISTAAAAAGGSISAQRLAAATGSIRRAIPALMQPGSAVNSTSGLAAAIQRRWFGSTPAVAAPRKPKATAASSAPAGAANAAAKPARARAAKATPKPNSKSIPVAAATASVTRTRRPTATVAVQSAAAGGAAVPSEGGSIEETYKKMTPREHILLRPEPYIGSVQAQHTGSWLLNSAGTKIVWSDVTFVPGFYQIFDEILVNAADNVRRPVRPRQPSMTAIRITLDPAQNQITVWNDGAGVPTDIHRGEKLHVPEMIFGHLLTSSNYDDTKKRFVGGRHGYGAKLTNIFSKEFVVDITDTKLQQTYRQVFRNNMLEVEKPTIVSTKGDTPTPVSTTQITFKPDLTRFGMTKWDSGLLSLMRRRVYDVAAAIASSGVRVYLNGTLVPVTSIESYLSLFPALAEGGEMVFASLNKHWQLAVGPTLSGPSHVSFVNGISTTRGGTHVGYVLNAVSDHLVDVLARQHRVKVTTSQVRQHLAVFVNCLVENPAFDSQVKECLITPVSKFGTDCSIPKSFLDNIVKKSGVVEQIVSWHETKVKSELARKSKPRSKTLNIPKLDDANLAGEADGRSSECTLILTEGDSAKALAMAGLAVLGRDRYGVFPLKGKLLNVRDVPIEMIAKNEEIANVIKILGLQFGATYPDRASLQSLRYGKVMLMTDQDHDGSHIKGLFINLIHHLWPNLIRQGFIEEFVTPIVKAVRSGHKPDVAAVAAAGTAPATNAGSLGDTDPNVRRFYTLPEYFQWKNDLGEKEIKLWKIKYYKGLGTSTANEAKEYFKDLERHRIKFVHTGVEDDAHIDLAFNKDKADLRKSWLARYGDVDNIHVDHRVKTLSFRDFVNKELILFSHADNIRSIPSMIDGLKPSQRKVLYGALKRRLTNEIKVVQLGGYVSEQTAYHHGEASLHSTIINMAQRFMGSNNLPLLTPNGQFGTRSQGGKDHASARYLYTQLDPLTRHLFRADDDGLLKYRDDDGAPIEPDWFVPVIPLVLINGAEGIGTGFSTAIPSYNPIDLIHLLRRKLHGLPIGGLVPWTRGFRGGVAISGPTGDTITYTGVVKLVHTTPTTLTYSISELPPGVTTDSYKQFLTEACTKPAVMNSRGGGGGDSSDGESTDAPPPLAQALHIKRYLEKHTVDNVSFQVMVTPQQNAFIARHGMEHAFRLVQSKRTSNMHLYDASGKIARFDSPLQIIEQFFPLRLEFYRKRKALLTTQREEAYNLAHEQIRFIRAVNTGDLKLSGKKRPVLYAELLNRKFVAHSKLAKPLPPDVTAAAAAAAAATSSGAVAATGGGGGGGGGGGADAAGVAVVQPNSPVVHTAIANDEFDYLLRMPIGSMTEERATKMDEHLANTLAELTDIRRATAEELWLRDLKSLEQIILKSPGGEYACTLASEWQLPATRYNPNQNVATTSQPVPTPQHKHAAASAAEASTTATEREQKKRPRS